MASLFRVLVPQECTGPMVAMNDYDLGARRKRVDLAEKGLFDIANLFAVALNVNSAQRRVGVGKVVAVLKILRAAFSVGEVPLDL